MPYKSEKQRRFIQGVAHGSITDSGMSQADAQSFAAHSKGKPIAKKKAAKKKAKARGKQSRGDAAKRKKSKEIKRVISTAPGSH